LINSNIDSSSDLLKVLCVDGWAGGACSELAAAQIRTPMAQLGQFFNLCDKRNRAGKTRH